MSININMSSLPNVGERNNNSIIGKEIKMVQATDYTKLSLHDQILIRPNMYMGSMSTEARREKILDFTDPNKPIYIYKDVILPPAFERLYFEILYNASDNVFTSRESNYKDIGSIDIMMDRKSIKIRNGGMPIPIEIHPSHNMWIPQLIFGVLLTSSTYTKKKRTGIGQNGYGSKLSNIFSKEFRVYVGNPNNGKTYYQVWKNNMKEVNEPIITEGYNGPSFTEIYMEPDFTRFFDKSLGITNYTDDIFGLFAGYAAEVSFSCKVPITFNGYPLNYSNLVDFMKLIVGYENNNYLIHYEYPNGTKLKQQKLSKGTVSVSIDPNILPVTEICLVDTPDSAMISSFVNSANTKNGGVHVETVYDKVGSYILKKINDTLTKGKEETTSKFKLTKTDLKSHLTVIISCWLDNPDCGTNEKTTLMSPKPYVSFEQKELITIEGWEFVNRLYSTLEAKSEKILGTNKKKRGRRLITTTIQDAYYAGTSEGYKCILYRTEGRSAMGYTHTMRSEFDEERRKYVGISCEKGKPMNVMNRSTFTIVNSKKYQELVEHIGLQSGLDYTIESNFRTLRYGALCILTDADVDGKHIASLIINVIHCRHPTLLLRPFLYLIRTPVVRVQKGTQKKVFYSMDTFKKWISNTPDFKNWDCKYCKGLASSDTEEVADDTKNPKVAQLIYDDNCSESMKLAFHKDLSDQRKKWISNYQLMEGIEEIQELPISDFIKYEAVQYAAINLARSIPKFDGLKESQRKIIHGSYQHWGKKTGSKVKPMKTSNLANDISAITNYHYGEKSLIDTINRMIEKYVGTNNLPHFVPKGLFGTRNDSGNDAGDARYTSTYPEWWWPYMYIQSDFNILDYIEDEGKKQEPCIMLPILPLGMINGVLGIGTGNSSMIPNFNVIDIYYYIRDKLTGGNGCALVPWYRYFKGTVELVHKNTISTKDENKPILVKTSKFKDDDDNSNLYNLTLDDLNTNEDGDIQSIDGLNDDDELNNIQTNETNQSKLPLKVVTKGLFNIIDEKKEKLIITELPVGKSIKKYDSFLSELKNQKEIKDYINDSRHDDPKFIIFGYGKYNNIEALGLQKTYSMTNMILLNEENRPIKFSDQYDLINKWIEWRAPYYDKRKLYELNEISKKIEHNTLKKKFIVAVLDGINNGYIKGQNIILVGNKKEFVLSQMRDLGIPEEYLNNSKGTHFTNDGIIKIDAIIKELNDKFIELNNISSTSLWIQDLDIFINKYLNIYPEEKTRLHQLQSRNNINLRHF